MNLLRLFFVLLFVFTHAQEEKRLALVIGNANYDKGELKNPVNDARLIASTLDSLNFDVILKENLESQNNFKRAILEFGKKRPNYDVAFVYYAGHGVQISDQNYLLPTMEEFTSEDEVKMFGVSVQDIMQFLEAQTNEVNILVLDACRNNPYESNWNPTRSSGGGGLAKIPPPTGSIIAFSTNSGQTAPDGDGENSVYTTSLAKNMMLEDTSIDQVFRNVRSEVLEATNQAQRPVEATQLTGQTFYLNTSNYEDDLLLAESLIFDEEKYLEALTVLEPIINKDYLNSRARNLRQEVYYGLEDYDKALNEINILIETDSLNAENHWDKGYIYRALNNTDLALGSFEKAVDLEQENPEAHYHLANFCYEIELYEKSEKHYLIATELDPELSTSNPELYCNSLYGLGVLYEYGFSDSTKALEQYFSIINGPLNIDWINSSTIYEDIGNIYRVDLDDFVSAEKYFFKQLDVFMQPTTFINLFEIYMLKNEKEKGLKILNEGASYFPDEPSFLLSEAEYYYYEMGGLKAEEAYIKAFESNPSDTRVLNAVANFYRLTNRLNESLSYYYRLISELESPEKFDVYDLVQAYAATGYVVYDIEGLSRALELFDKAVSISPLDGHVYRAGFFSDIGMINEAEADYNKAVELKKDNWIVLYNRAVFYFNSGLYEKAEEEILRYLDVFPSNMDALFLLGKVYTEAEMADEALDIYFKLLDLDGDGVFARINSLYGDIGANYSRLGKYEKAIEYHKKQIEIQIEFDFTSYENLSEIYLFLGQEEKAAEVLFEALETQPSSELVLSGIGSYYFFQEKYKEGIVYYERALSKKIKPEFYFYIATSHMRLGNKEDALLNYIKAADTDSADAFAKKQFLYSDIGELYEYHFNNSSLALEYYDKELEVNPESYRGLLNKFKLLVKTKDFINALRTINVFVDVFNDEEAYLKRSSFYETHVDNLDLALEDLKIAKNIVVSDPSGEYSIFDIEYQEAQFYFRQKDYAVALEKHLLLEKNYKKDDYYNSSLLTDIGDIYQLMGDYASALKYYNKELKSSPDFVYAIQKRAELYAFFLKNKERAEQDYDRGFEIDPENNNLNLSYINYKFSNKDFNEVLALADLAIKRDAKDPQGNYIKALAYKELQKPLSQIYEINASIEKIENYSQEGYFITDINGSVLDFSRVFIERAEIYLSFGEIELACKDLNRSKYYVNSESLEQKIKKSLSKNCN